MEARKHPRSKAGSNYETPPERDNGLPYLEGYSSKGSLSSPSRRIEEAIANGNERKYEPTRAEDSSPTDSPSPRSLPDEDTRHISESDRSSAEPSSSRAYSPRFSPSTEDFIHCIETGIRFPSDSSVPPSDSSEEEKTGGDHELEPGLQLASPREQEGIQIPTIDLDARLGDKEDGHDEDGHDEGGHDEGGHDEGGHDESGHDEDGHDEEQGQHDGRYFDEVGLGLKDSRPDIERAPESGNEHYSKTRWYLEPQWERISPKEYVVKNTFDDEPSDYEIVEPDPEEPLRATNPNQPETETSGPCQESANSSSRVSTDYLNTSSQSRSPSKNTLPSNISSDWNETLQSELPSFILSPEQSEQGQGQKETSLQSNKRSRDDECAKTEPSDLLEGEPNKRHRIIHHAQPLEINRDSTRNENRG
ncbi:uncharacterized protein BDV17DRAFT_147644 [Aspergillus undulatus]|uniref:uncharacterized protein n=1 Tax=Aspergillus undulatus TaxID=1810928 RepID=UPI003CCE13A5